MFRYQTQSDRLFQYSVKKSVFGLNRFLLIILILMPLADDLTAQQQTGRGNEGQENRDLEAALEQAELDDPDAELTELWEIIQDLMSQPVDLNLASLDDLLQVPNLSHRLAQNILDYRSMNGSFTSVDQLLEVTGIGPVTLDRIRPFVTVPSEGFRGISRILDTGSWTQNSQFEGYSRYRQLLQAREGYQRAPSEGGYLGPPFSYYQRIRYRSNHLSLNLTQDKDPGEPISYPLEFDFTSWHLALQNRNGLRALIIGDYSISFGQGLLLWSGGAFGKSSNSIGGLVKNERGVRPFTSAQEASGFRGVAVTTDGNVQFTGFYSNRKRTASKVDDVSVHFPISGGLHRTLSERSRRNNLGQETYGGRVRALFEPGYIGVSAFHNRFDKYIAEGHRPYQKHLFSGQELSGYSVDFRFLMSRVQVFGEFAYTDNGGYGLLTGTVIQADPQTDVAVAYRYYDPALQSIFGAGFGEQSGYPRNEEGFYLGITHSINSRIQIRGYVDYFRFPSPRFQTTQSTAGQDILIHLEYKPFRNFNMYTLFRMKSREQEVSHSDPFGRELRILGNHQRANARVHAEYQIFQNLRLRFRFDLIRTNTAQGETFWGTLLYKDVRILPLPNVRIDARITLFDADDFESRLYQFENDLLYVLSNTMLTGRGQRIYLLLHYRPSHRFDLWMKAATTVYENQNVISSGLNQIRGNRRSDIGIQVRFRF